MFVVAAADAGHPAVAALLGLGAAGVAGVVVAMAWSVHTRQIRFAEQLTRRQLIVTTEGSPAAGAAERAATLANYGALSLLNGDPARARELLPKALPLAADPALRSQIVNNLALVNRP